MMKLKEFEYTLNRRSGRAKGFVTRLLMDLLARNLRTERGSMIVGAMV